jgi:hypothetical protein
MFIPADPDLDFLPIPDLGLGVKKALDTGCATLYFLNSFWSPVQFTVQLTLPTLPTEPTVYLSQLC